MKIKIKYCGGCNSNYDRVNLVTRLVESMRAKYQNQIEVAFRDEPADIGLIICGCSTCCADRDDIKNGVGNWFVIGPGMVDYKNIAQQDVVEHLLRTISWGRGNSW